MVTTRKGSSGIGSGQSRTPVRTLVEVLSSTGGPVRVWSEASVTVAVTDDPPQFVKFTHGFERMSPSSSKADIVRTERLIFERCEEIVDRRVRRLARLIKQLNRD